MLTDKEIEEKFKAIESRNIKVEADKAWETSNERKISVAVVTYLVVLIVMYLLWFENIFISALIPMCGYLLSTLWINPMKEKYLKKYMNNK